ncbi:MAG: hypothetical protein E6G94_10110 [Alphaproteobacteria bacterium]|nr:MAG: hypothetical protein E6G94_10110 [Alphaproteobacteria bacterium]
MGIAQFFTSEGSRVGRRDGKAFELVRKVDAARLDLTRGLQLRLKGQLAAVPGRHIALCRAEGPGRPACLLGALFDEVAVVNPATGETLATWDVSAPDTRAPAR